MFRDSVNNMGLFFCEKGFQLLIPWDLFKDSGLVQLKRKAMQVMEDLITKTDVITLFVLIWIS